MKEMSVKEYQEAGRYAALVDTPKAVILSSMASEKVNSVTSGILEVIKENDLSLEQADLMLDIVRGHIHRATVVR